MTSRREGIAVIGERRSHLSDRDLVEVWRARCEAGAQGDYLSLDPRLFIVLEPLDGVIELDVGDAAHATASRDRSVSFVPAGTPLRMRVRERTEVRHLDLHFSAGRIAEIVGSDIGAGPLLMAPHDRVQRLARLLVDLCGCPTPASTLLGDGLVAALLMAALRPDGLPAARRSALSDRQLRLAVDYIEERCAEAIRLQELAALTDLSETYFSHAFKAATGMPPHRWQLQARLRRAGEMLARSDAPLASIAIATGFADQSHFTRIFRKLTGEAPSSWRALRRSGAAAVATFEAE